MVWIILAALGVPLWLIAAALLTLVVRNRSLRHRPGDMAVRVMAPGKKRWKRGHAIWVHDVFSFRGSPAAWSEVLVHVQEAETRPPTPDEAEKLRRLDDPIVATMHVTGGGTLKVAAAGTDRAKVLAPFDAAVLGNRALLPD